VFFKDVVDLINIEMLPNDNDVEVETEISRKTDIFVDKKSIRQSEFYQASAQGINLVQMFEMNSDDYEGEKKLEYNGADYYIVRTYDKNGEIVQLICSDKLMKVSANGTAR